MSVEFCIHCKYVETSRFPKLDELWRKYILNQFWNNVVIPQLGITNCKYIRHLYGTYTQHTDGSQYGDILSIYLVLEDIIPPVFLQAWRDYCHNSLLSSDQLDFNVVATSERRNACDMPGIFVIEKARRQVLGLYPFPFSRIESTDTDINTGDVYLDLFKLYKTRGDIQFYHIIRELLIPYQMHIEPIWLEATCRGTLERKIHFVYSTDPKDTYDVDLDSSKYLFSCAGWVAVTGKDVRDMGWYLPSNYKPTHAELYR